MMYFLTILTFLLTLAPALVAANVPLLPSQDDFYIQPSNISSYNPGDLIRTRILPPKLQGLTPVSIITVGAAYQHMIRTTDALDNPVAAVMTYLVPETPDNGKLLAYSIAYDTPNNDCSPSYGIQPAANTSVGTDIILIQAALDNGWHVVTSDYEGLKAQFAVGKQAGQTVLDSIRASLNPSFRAATQLSESAQYAIFGYSGGSIASGWAAELAPSYASELTNFVGTAMGGVVSNLTSTMNTINQGLPAGLAFAGMQGLANAYEGLASYMDEHLLPDTKDEYYFIGGSCMTESLDRGLLRNLFSFVQGQGAMMQVPAIVEALADAGDMGAHGVPKQPLFVYKAIADEVSPIEDTDDLMALYCNQGATFQYQRNTVGEHITESYIGSAAAFAWLKDRFDGVPLSQPTRCWSADVTIFNITDLPADVALGKELVAALQTALGNSLPPFNASMTLSV